MNRTIKTFYKCSTKSLFLKYKTISKKAAKLGSFLQCSVHIFLGLDGDFGKINFENFWNHIMKNFQVKHGQCDSINFSKTFFFFLKSLSNYCTFALLTAGCYTFNRSWNLPANSIIESIIELLVLQCFFCKGSNKKQRGGGG